VYGEQEGGDEDQLSHLNRRIAQNTTVCKTSRRCLLSAKKEWSAPFKHITSRIDFRAWSAEYVRAFSWWEAELLVSTPHGARPLTAT
jgi:hypothetical protein